MFSIYSGGTNFNFELYGNLKLVDVKSNNTTYINCKIHIKIAVYFLLSNVQKVVMRLKAKDFRIYLFGTKLIVMALSLQAKTLLFSISIHRYHGQN